MQSALDWLGTIVTGALNVHFGKAERFEAGPLSYRDDGTWLPKFVARYNPDPQEFAVLILALAPHVAPGFLNRLLTPHLPEGGDFPEFGGVKAGGHRGIQPTGETAQFVLAGDDLERRLAVQAALSPSHWLHRNRIVRLEAVREGEPAMSGRLLVEAEFLEEILTGRVSRPAFSIDFPAEYIETEMDWNDLVLHPHTMRQVREIENWVKHSPTLLRDWGMSKRIKPGYRALFYGPPGTGKTLTATLLGRQTGRDVFRIDLSRVVSKYIGETEKNLSRLFDRAEHKDWILFFDEADALFGKRTDIRDAHDKYANQEVAYLLQRIEAYNGLVILATNQRGNIDDAFVRRFQAIIHFPMPRAEERRQLWEKTFPPQIALGTGVDWEQVATRHELTGAAILNVMHYCAIEVLAQGADCLTVERLEAAILREYVKEGRVV